MRRERRDELIVMFGLVVLVFAVVAFTRVVLSPLVASFIAGLGIGAVGVFAILRSIARGGRPPI
jgi:uncharacterized membrane protein HdeD (DUF308 family)